MHPPARVAHEGLFERHAVVEQEGTELQQRSQSRAPARRADGELAAVGTHAHHQALAGEHALARCQRVGQALCRVELHDAFVQ